jgi:16S rRNA (cytosine1402-N4)-methyltransferase
MLRAASLEDLEGWLRRAGEERFAGKLARRLKDLAPGLGSTADLAEAVARCVPRRGKSHPATRVFLALRMAVNREMESLDDFLARAARVLKPGGRLAVLTFHSEEDRRVKEAGRGGPPWRAVTKKPLDGVRGRAGRKPAQPQRKLRVLEKI